MWLSVQRIVILSVRRIEVWRANKANVSNN
jgi:hypothetical protein